MERDKEQQHPLGTTDVAAVLIVTGLIAIADERLKSGEPLDKRARDFLLELVKILPNEKARQILTKMGALLWI